MAPPEDVDIEMEDDFDEEADSDFEGADGEEEIVSSSSDDEETAQAATGRRPAKRRKVAKPKKVEEEIVELDSGDEATIKEREKDLKKQRKRGEDIEDDLNDQAPGWRAKTRSMRDRDNEEKKKSRLATVKGSTIDVNKIWEDMNRSKPLPPPKIEVIESMDGDTTTKQRSALQPQPPTLDENVLEEMITIKRSYKFAGEVHTEEKVVPKSSAEAKLWLSQQSFQSQTALGAGATLRRPLRRISRFLTVASLRGTETTGPVAFPLDWSTNCTRTLPRPSGVARSSACWMSFCATASFWRLLGGGTMVAISTKGIDLRMLWRSAARILRLWGKKGSRRLSQTFYIT